MNAWNTSSKPAPADNPQDTFNCVCLGQILKKNV